ncbi:Protein of unknown function [Duganella sp. CF517]|uniref:DUF3443 domain-containing protein n=1 Tax=Duganella sp. CF517 TaxID=1881038 RepID=UPI0008AD421F|nr:DUF3443 domain-containing protein [Duganella sp. CF517]SEN36223.1 Protein of unknown function [Duganella sp. CF517]
MTPAAQRGARRPAWVRAVAGAMLAVALAACGGGSAPAATATTSASTAAMPDAAAATPVVSISATPTATTSGQLVTLNWSVSNAPAAGCAAAGAWSGARAASGSETVIAGAAGAANYTLTCGGASGTAAVVVSTPPPTPTTNLALAPATVTTAQTSVLSWSSANATGCIASGAWSGARATSGAVTIAAAGAGHFTYSLTCSGDGGSASASAALSVTAALSNSIPISVDSGPAGVGGVINVPYVDVTVCRPGTATCQVIDHVLLDTGSYGLRLLASALDTGLALPAVPTPSGADAAECGKFISGYTWGAVRRADVRMADELAAGIPIQVVGDGGAGYAATPASCSSAGNNLGTLAALGAKGILGVGLFRHDCGDACARAAIAGVYYACAGGACTASAMPLASQVGNPVAAFAVNNNGVLVSLPAVGTAGLTSVSGTLIFGVNTQANNGIAGETVFKTDSGGDFRTTYKGKTSGSSFIDSGSNGYFFTDATIRTCSGGDFFCPAAALALSATTTAADGSASATVAFDIVNLVQLASTVRAAPVGGPLTGAAAGDSDYFDWGLPFFYGRRVFVVLEGATVNGKTGPLWAY